MQDAKCCGSLMYQEIDKQNYLLSICRICGKTTKHKVNFSGASNTKFNIENFNGNLEEGQKDV